MMARTVDRRYVSASDVLNAFRVAEASRPGETNARRSGEHNIHRPPSAAAPHVAPHGRARLMAVLLIVAVVIGIAAVLTIMGVRAARHTEPARPPVATGTRPLPPIGSAVTRKAPIAPAEAVVEDDAPDIGALPDIVALPRLAPLTEGTKGCGKEPLLRGAGDLRFDVDEVVNVDRYDAYIPHAYEPNHPHPLLLLIHESGDPPPEFIQYSGFIPLAEQAPFVILAPFDGDNFTDAWRDSSDVARIRSAIDDASSTLCIDTGRIFAVGHASGGRMAESLPCDLGGIAAIATTAHRGGSQAATHTCAPKKPVPYLTIAGRLDEYSPFEGGAGCGSVKISLDERERIWRKRNRCGGERKSWFQYGKNTCDTWNCEAPFVSCRLDGGRQWTGSAPRVLPRLFGKNCDGRQANFPFAETIWRFFVEHTRP
jgi:polyhydroxybutyrate depolymerase